METLVTIDIGGSSIKYAFFNRQGQLLKKSSLKTPTCNCREEIPRLIIDLVEDHRQMNIRGLGISSAGNVDRELGRILYSADIKDYSGCDLGPILEEALGLTVLLENDVDGAGLGEKALGAARGYENIVCLTLGTGIGSSIFIGGEIYRGQDCLGGDLGHMVIEKEGRPCNCGNRGCLERYASTSSLLRSYEEISLETGLNGKDFMARLIEGEDMALGVFNEFLDYLSLGLANIIHMLAPELIVIGGGISESDYDFIGELEERLDERLMPSYRKRIKIRKAELGNDAGLLGMFLRIREEVWGE